MVILEGQLLCRSRGPNATLDWKIFIGDRNCWWWDSFGWLISCWARETLRSVSLSLPLELVRFPRGNPSSLLLWPGSQHSGKGVMEVLASIYMSPFHFPSFFSMASIVASPVKMLCLPCLHAQWLSCVCFVTPWTVAHQAPLSMGFLKQECWSGCHFLLQGIFLTQE